jgi:predicted nuclease of predicted toxin-antitoxin system
MKLLLDMNLSPDWVQTLAALGWKAVHWSSIGDPRAEDREIMAWASANNYVVVTHDLDFGAMLVATQAARPSVIQARAQNVTPLSLAPVLDRVLRQFQPELEAGALVVFDVATTRVRILPHLPRS